MLAPQLFALARLRAVLQGPSASLHWDGLLDLLIPTDPNHAFIFFPLSCLTPTWAFFSVSLISFSVLHFICLCVCLLPLLGIRVVSKTQGGAFLLMLLIFFYDWRIDDICAPYHPQTSTTLPRVSARKGHKWQALQLYVRVEGEMHLGFSRLPDLCWLGQVVDRYSPDHRYQFLGSCQGSADFNWPILVSIRLVPGGHNNQC